MSNYYELTVAQRTIMDTVNFAFNKRKMLESNIYLNCYFFVKENCDFDTLEKAYEFVVKENDSLRLFFYRRGIKTVQKILPKVDSKLEHITLKDQEDFKAFYENLRYYDLPVMNNNPIKGFIVHIGNQGALVFRVHHLLMDGYGAYYLLKDIETFYSNEIKGENTIVDSKSIEKYFEIDRKYREKIINQDRKYWLKTHFKQKKYKSIVPYCRAQNCITTRYTIDEGRMKELRECFSSISSNKIVSVQSFMSFLIGLTLYRISGSRNFAFSNLSHGRRTFALKQCIGNMVELIPQYCSIKEDQTFLSNYYSYNDDYLMNMKHGKLPLFEHLCLVTPTALVDKLNYQHFWWLQFSAMDDINDLKTDSFDVDIQAPKYMRYPFYIGMYGTLNDSIYFDLEHQKDRFPVEKTDIYWKLFLESIDMFINHKEESVKSIIDIKGN